MIKRTCSVAFVVAAASILSAGSARAATKVSCVGEQSTHSGHPAAGAGHEWPDELGTVLGAGYTVDNDGDNGHSSVLMNDTAATPVPYTNNGGSYANPANAGITATGGGGYVRSITTHDYVIIGPWGMHDTKMWMGNTLPSTQARFQQDYDFLVSIYLKLTPKPKVILTTALPFPTGGNVTAETQAYMKDAITPAVKAVGAKYNLPVVDLFTVFSAGPATLLASDGGVNLTGSQKIAMLVAAAITGNAGTGGTGGAAGAGGSTGAGGAGGAMGTAGTTGAAGATGAAGTTGTAGATGASGTTGAAGTTGASGSTGTGAAGASGSTGSTAGSTGMTPGSGGGGCAVGGDVAGKGALVGLSIALAVALARRRRKSA